MPPAAEGSLHKFPSELGSARLRVSADLYPSKGLRDAWKVKGGETNSPHARMLRQQSHNNLLAGDCTHFGVVPSSSSRVFLTGVGEAAAPGTRVQP